jgi:hypothetical protein
VTRKTYTRRDELISAPGRQFLRVLGEASREPGSFEVEFEEDTVTLTTKQGTVITLVAHGVERDETKPEKVKRKRITRAKLHELAFTNSSKIDGPVEVDGRSMRFVGIGWVDEGPATGKETLFVGEPKLPKPKLGWASTPNGLVLHLYDPERPYRGGTHLNPLCRPRNTYRGTLNHARCVNEASKKDLSWRTRCRTCEKKAIKLGIKLEGRPS